ncbi:MAG: hypothetical protein EHM42_11815, partial [Planctomycetaceae bacterium]
MRPFFACLCPTYYRPLTLVEAIACFHAQQDVSAESARLFICDDSGVYGDGQLHFPRITFDSSSTRFDSLPSKYNTMAERALNYHRWLLDTSPTPVGPLVFVVWEDDDIYLPDHLTRLAQSWELDGPFAWAHPDRVGSDYPGHYIDEGAG